MLRLLERPDWYVCVRKYGIQNSALKAMKSDGSKGFQKRCSFFIEKVEDGAVRSEINKAINSDAMAGMQHSPVEIRHLLDDFVSHGQSLVNRDMLLRNPQTKQTDTEITPEPLSNQAPQQPQLDQIAKNNGHLDSYEFTSNNNKQQMLQASAYPSNNQPYQVSMDTNDFVPQHDSSVETKESTMGMRRDTVPRSNQNNDLENNNSTASVYQNQENSNFASPPVDTNSNFASSPVDTNINIDVDDNGVKVQKRVKNVYGYGEGAPEEVQENPEVRKNIRKESVPFVIDDEAVQPLKKLLGIEDPIIKETTTAVIKPTPMPVKHVYADVHGNVHGYSPNSLIGKLAAAPSNSLKELKALGKHVKLGKKCKRSDAIDVAECDDGSFESIGGDHDEESEMGEGDSMSDVAEDSPVDSMTTENADGDRDSETEEVYGKHNEGEEEEEEEGEGEEEEQHHHGHHRHHHLEEEGEEEEDEGKEEEVEHHDAEDEKNEEELKKFHDEEHEWTDEKGDTHFYTHEAWQIKLEQDRQNNKTNTADASTANQATNATANLNGTNDSLNTTVLGFNNVTDLQGNNTNVLNSTDILGANTTEIANMTSNPNNSTSSKNSTQLLNYKDVQRITSNAKIIKDADLKFNETINAWDHVNTTTMGESLSNMIGFNETKKQGKFVEEGKPAVVDFGIERMTDATRNVSQSSSDQSDQSVADRLKATSTDVLQKKAEDLPGNKTSLLDNNNLNVRNATDSTVMSPVKVVDSFSNNELNNRTEDLSTEHSSHLLKIKTSENSTVAIDTSAKKESKSTNQKEISSEPSAKSEAEIDGEQNNDEKEIETFSLDKYMANVTESRNTTKIGIAQSSNSTNALSSVERDDNKNSELNKTNELSSIERVDNKNSELNKTNENSSKVSKEKEENLKPVKSKSLNHLPSAHISPESKFPTLAFLNVSGPIIKKMISDLLMKKPSLMNKTDLLMASLMAGLTKQPLLGNESKKQEESVIKHIRNSTESLLVLPDKRVHTKKKEGDNLEAKSVLEKTVLQKTINESTSDEHILQSIISDLTKKTTTSVTDRPAHKYESSAMLSDVEAALEGPSDKKNSVIKLKKLGGKHKKKLLANNSTGFGKKTKYTRRKNRKRRKQFSPQQRARMLLSKDKIPLNVISKFIENRFLVKPLQENSESETKEELRKEQSYIENILKDDIADSKNSSSNSTDERKEKSLFGDNEGSGDAQFDDQNVPPQKQYPQQNPDQQTSQQQNPDQQTNQQPQKQNVRVESMKDIKIYQAEKYEPHLEGLKIDKNIQDGSGNQTKKIEKTEESKGDGKDVENGQLKLGGKKGKKFKHAPSKKATAANPTWPHYDRGSLSKVGTNENQQSVKHTYKQSEIDSKQINSTKDDAVKESTDLLMRQLAESTEMLKQRVQASNNSTKSNISNSLADDTRKLSNGKESPDGEEDLETYSGFGEFDPNKMNILSREDTKAIAEYLNSGKPEKLAIQGLSEKNLESLTGQRNVTSTLNKSAEKRKDKSTTKIESLSKLAANVFPVKEGNAKEMKKKNEENTSLAELLSSVLDDDIPLADSDEAMNKTDHKSTGKKEERKKHRRTKERTSQQNKAKSFSKEMDELIAKDEDMQALETLDKTTQAILNADKMKTAGNIENSPKLIAQDHTMYNQPPPQKSQIKDLYPSKTILLGNRNPDSPTFAKPNQGNAAGNEKAPVVTQHKNVQPVAMIRSSSIKLQGAKEDIIHEFKQLLKMADQTTQGENNRENTEGVELPSLNALKSSVEDLAEAKTIQTEQPGKVGEEGDERGGTNEAATLRLLHRKGGLEEMEDQEPANQHKIVTVKNEAEKEIMVNGLVTENDRCVSIQFNNELGNRYVLVSSINSHGYTPRGKIFTLKQVFKDPRAHRYVSFHATDEDDPTRIVLLNGARELIAVPVSCKYRPREIRVTSQQPSTLSANLFKKDGVNKLTESDENEIATCPPSCTEYCNPSCPSSCCSSRDFSSKQPAQESVFYRTKSNRIPFDDVMNGLPAGQQISDSDVGMMNNNNSGPAAEEYPEESEKFEW